MKTREIKYKSLYRGEWYNVIELQLYSDGVIYPSRFEFEEFSPDSEHIKCTVQYTGLKDKNGKEIYEGDIVTYPNRECFGVVKFGEYEFGSYDTYQRGLGFYIDSKNSSAQGCFTNVPIEVIGNIYQNPELL